VLNLDPAKLLVIAVVAVILLGPDKLPQVARQAGAAWRSFNEFRHRMEAEVRSSIPDLPSSADIARMARSPSALLNHLSTMAPDEAGAADGADLNGAAGAGAAGAGAAGSDRAGSDGAASGDPSGAEPIGEQPATTASTDPAVTDSATVPPTTTMPTPSTPPSVTPTAHRAPGVVAPQGVVGDPSLN
jgi:sec-independent protein translocase protein TatB